MCVCVFYIVQTSNYQYNTSPIHMYSSCHFMPQGIDVTLRNRVTTREILAVTRSTAPRSLTVLGKNGKGFRYPQMAARFRLVKYCNVPIFLNREREKGGRKKNKHIVYAVYVQIYKYNFIRILML